jgi:hypothetical protein
LAEQALAIGGRQVMGGGAGAKGDLDAGAALELGERQAAVMVGVEPGELGRQARPGEGGGGHGAEAHGGQARHGPAQAARFPVSRPAGLDQRLLDEAAQGLAG